MKRAKREVQKKIQALRARRDRMQSEQREERFKEKFNRRFKVPRTGETHGQRLHVNGQVLTDKEAVLKALAHHFEDLSSNLERKIYPPIGMPRFVTKISYLISYH